jgi:hypothetical protein
MNVVKTEIKEFNVPMNDSVVNNDESKVKTKIKEKMEYHEEKFARLQKEYERSERELARELKPLDDSKSKK